MNVRIVVADEREANFFDAINPKAPLAEKGTLVNKKAGLKDKDMETDRPGRRYGGSQGVKHANQVGGHHHGVDGERSTEQHELGVFAKQVANKIDTDRSHNEFDRLVIMAAPKMLGMLRKSLPDGCQPYVIAEIAKDFMHHDSATILKALPPDAFWELRSQ
jgi:protein required for attachment to host cells